MVIPSSLLHTATKSFLWSFHLPFKVFQNSSQTLTSLAKMSSWTCSMCTFINPPTQKSNCEICLSAHPQSLPLSSTSTSSSTPSSPSTSKWSCASCTLLNPYSSTICEICGTRASASLLSNLEIDYDELDKAQLGSSVGSVFLPLQACSNSKKINGEKSDVGCDDTGFSGKLKGAVSPLRRGDNGNFGSGGSQYVGNGGSGEFDSGGESSFSAALRPCCNKRKDREHTGANGVRGDPGASCGIGAATAACKAAGLKSSDEIHFPSDAKVWKFLSYNIWFRVDVEMHNRMKALGNLIELHSPDVICFQEVTPSFYEIFQQSRWWKGYQCSISDETAFPGAYFCMQLCKLPVKSYICKPFQNSIMGRELCIAEVDVHPDLSIAVATSHLESPCPAPPTWDQMFSKERVVQANEAVRFLDKNQNVIFCGDMNWDDKLDGPFPLPDGWMDAWTELRHGEVGWTYDTKSNKMLSGNRTLQKRLDRVVCKLKDFKITEIEMIGKDAIPGLSYVKEKRVKGQVKKLELPVLPSDHYGLLLTLSSSGST